MLKQITGDLLKIEQGIILHQVNAVGVTGGLAGALRRKWPNAFRDYSYQCMGPNRSELLGKLSPGLATEDPILAVFHLFGQAIPGPYTDLCAVEQAFTAAAEIINIDPLKYPIYAPHMMGCGLGGGDWSEYSAIIERHLPQCIIVKKFTN